VSRPPKAASLPFRTRRRQSVSGWASADRDGARAAMDRFEPKDHSHPDPGQRNDIAAG